MTAVFSVYRRRVARPHEQCSAVWRVQLWREMIKWVAAEPIWRIFFPFGTAAMAVAGAVVSGYRFNSRSSHLNLFWNNSRKTSAPLITYTPTPPPPLCTPALWLHVSLCKCWSAPIKKDRRSSRRWSFFFWYACGNLWPRCPFWPFLAGSPDGLQPYDDGMWEKKWSKLAFSLSKIWCFCHIHQFIKSSVTLIDDLD